jgi:asparagine synthase (glutamine-hydrolysing)
MCGIVGIVGVDLKDPSLIEGMASLLRHRGPDSHGIWKSAKAHLGFRRLAILDLSEAGSQPRLGEDLALVFNGEVYNFRELRQHLPGAFQSQSDSEVVHRCFRVHGIEGITKLDGMFAFAAWDERTEELFLVRDRFGIKPLYYRPTADGIAFASEVEPLLELGRPAIDRSTLRDYLTYGYIPTPKTPWKGIFKLPAAHFLRWHRGEIAIHRYWRLEPQERNFGEQEAAQEAEELLERAIRESSVSDVPLGVFLSGGVDSGTIAAFSDPSIQAFTLGQPEKHRDETADAAILAQHLGIRHFIHHEETIDLETGVDAIVSAFGEPFGDSAALSVWLISRFTSQHVKVTLSGEGGDELFYGYRWYGRAMTDPPSRWQALIAGVAPTLTKLGRSSSRRSSVGLERFASFVGTFTPVQVRKLAGPALGSGQEQEDPLWHYRRYWRDDLPLQQCLQMVDFQTYLPDDLLTKVDRASMAFSLEVRPPFLDHRLAEFAVSLPPGLHRNPVTDQGKSLLRRVVRGRLPEGYLERPKRGFNLAIGRWARRHPELWQGALRRLEGNEIIRAAKVLDLTNDQVWSLLVLDRWLTKHDSTYVQGGWVKCQASVLECPESGARRVSMSVQDALSALK